MYVVRVPGEACLVEVVLPVVECRIVVDTSNCLVPRRARIPAGSGIMPPVPSEELSVPCMFVAQMVRWEAADPSTHLMASAGSVNEDLYRS